MTEQPLVCAHPSNSVVLGDVDVIGEPRGIPFERVIFVDVPKAARSILG